MATPRPICPVVVNVVATNITGFGSPNDSRRRVRSRIVFFAATAIGVVLAVCSWLHGTRAPQGWQERKTPREACRARFSFVSRLSRYSWESGIRHLGSRNPGGNYRRVQRRHRLNGDGRLGGHVCQRAQPDDRACWHTVCGADEVQSGTVSGRHESCGQSLQLQAGQFHLDFKYRRKYKYKRKYEQN